MTPLLCASLCLAFVQSSANPLGGTVSQGAASFKSHGPQLTIHTSDRAFINWSSFNIGVGETTSFIQPSSSSIVWNQIHDSNPSQILGNLNANGYVILQNQSGFYIGGQASITAHGLLLTTAPIPMPDLISGGAWQFSAPPPTAKIINYGQLSTDKGGSAFLIAHDIENHGTISANEGSLGLFAGKDVLISERPDGRGLSAQVTLPEGSVDNTGKLIADAGTIALRAQVVNQGGVVQANSVREVNGAIQLVASDAINLGAGSQILAKGDEQGLSPGGTVLIKSAGSFSDQATASIDISGGAQGGNGGQVEISAPRMSAIHSRIDGQAAEGFLGGKLLIDPDNILLANSGDAAPSSGVVNPGDPPSQGSPDTLTLDVTSFSPSLSQITLQATKNIKLSAGTVWTLADPGVAAKLTLSAGNNITFDDGSAIQAGNNWSVNLVAGTLLNSASGRQAGSDGVYLNGSSYIQTQNGHIGLWAANEVLVDSGDPSTVGNNGIRTLAGGSIDVTALYGDVNSGGNPQGYLFGQRAKPYYGVSQTLGGISTAAGGDVTITAGGNVTSYLPEQNDYLNAKFDGGSGAFGPQPGNVTIAAGGNVSGHYVVANGIGEISAGGDAGAPTASGGFALSLVKGTWSVSAPNGSIYVQDIRNPNGIFNDNTKPGYAGYHYFDYDPSASVLLQAANTVEITGAGAPHTTTSAPNTPIPFLFPPSLQVIAGSGGFVLGADVILFPSPSGDLRITTHNGGNFQSFQDPNDPVDLIVHSLEMSDSAARQWDPSGNSSFGTFLRDDNAPTPPELDNPNPVEISVSGSMNNVTVRTTKATHVTVGGDMFNAGLLGENLGPGDVTSINVAGKISYPPIYSFQQLGESIVGADLRNPSAWDGIFSLLVDPVRVAALDVPGNASPADLTAYADSVRLSLAANHTLSGGFLFDPNANPGFVYDRSTGQLGFQFRMNQTIRSVLEGPLETIKLDDFGRPMIQHGLANLGQDPTKFYFATTTLNFVAPAEIEALYNKSLSAVQDDQHLSPGFQIGGPGRFTVNAASMDLGSSHGIISWGIGNGGQSGALDYGTLAGVTPAEKGASVLVTVADDLNLLTSTIASIDGGKVSVHSQAGAVTLSLGDFSLIPSVVGAVCYGIFTSGDSSVEVGAEKDINVGGARIAAFNGGNVFVESDRGNVNAGNGANSTLVVPVIYRDPASGLLISSTIQDPRPYGSGILAISTINKYQAPGSSGLPGDIIVNTPQGDIVSTLGGVQQFALNGSIAGGPTITLTAGTAASAGSPGFAGNVDLGQGGVIGGTINITAQGNIKGLIVSHQNSTINAAQGFSGTLLSGGLANVSAGAGAISGTIIGIGGVNASGGAGVTAALLGQNVSIGGGAAQSTLGTTASATATSTAAAGQANTVAQQEVGTKTTSQDDEDKKKNGLRPSLVRRVGRVTVILPPAS
ncbi:MAG TPA: filamentous hemagglutinin N-terminal domain-containing protein [Candidatus Binatia bacterium]|nr:filamentous hemagglutinin N-terminal domain-containing protein [Candidatus Binatia bacterium]